MSKQDTDTDACTGERYMPEFDGDWTLEHTHRYLLARELAQGKTVLDIACGDGYGSRMLADVAARVVGVDISLETVARARAKYPHPRLFFLEGNATAIPLAGASVDLVASFETIEHLAGHEEMLDEIRRVLRPGGIVLISSPDKYEYSDRAGYANEFHVKELYREEFVTLLEARFPHLRILGQRVLFGSVIGAENDAPFFSWRKNEPDSRTTGLLEAEYWLVLAGDDPLPALPSSILKTPLDQSDFARSAQSVLDETRTHLRDAREYIRLLSAHNTSLEGERARLNVAKEILEKELYQLYASRSWRVTAPMRFVVSRLRRLLFRSAGPAMAEAEASERQPSAQEFSSAPPVWPPDVRALEKPLALEENAQPSPVQLGVFLHIYYPELAEEMFLCVNRLPETAMVHISTDTEAKKAQLLEMAGEQGLEGRTEVRVCPNKGWDLAPFLVGFADVIPRYPLLLRLHSKRSLHMGGVLGDRWRTMLFASLAGSVERVNAILQAFERDPGLGMVCPPIAKYYAHCVHCGGNFPIMREILARNGVVMHPDMPIDFPMGSMFWCRPAVLSPWLKGQFSYNDFLPLTSDNRDISLAHAMERLFFFGCGITGYSWARLRESSDSSGLL